MVTAMKAMLASFWEYALNTAFKTIHWDEARCDGCLNCYEVCPVGCCRPDPTAPKILPPDQASCVACGACVLQCPEEALALVNR
jgi:NAD-dependent dihydropyrimidine dehydrogenase PreA subunit